jgi:O-antigen ligase
VPPAALAIAAVCSAVYRWPERTLALTPLLILVADTKFRARDAVASLRGEIDAQVMLELGLYGLCGLVVVVVTKRKRLPRLPVTASEAALLAFGAMAVASSAWSSAPVFTLVRGCQLVLLFLLGRTLLAVLGPPVTFRIFGAGLLAYVVVCASVAIGVPSTVVASGEPDAFGRFTWFAIWPTQAARCIGLALLLLGARALFPSPGSRRSLGPLPWWIWLLPLAYMLVETYSRTPLIACALALGALIALKYLRLWQATALIGVSALVVMVAVNLGATVHGLIERGSESHGALAGVIFRGQTAAQFASLSNRVTLWQGVWQLFLERPLLGYGYQGSRAYLLALLPWAGHAHNALAQAALDLGVPGVAFVAVGLGSCLSPRHLRAARSGGDLVGWRVTVLVVALFLLVVSASAESFEEPGFEALVFATCVLGRARVRREAALEARPRATRPASAASMELGSA